MRIAHPSRRVPARTPLLLASALVWVTGPARGQWATFELIPELPSNQLHGVTIYAITPDGSKAVGFSSVGNFEIEACLWTRGVGTVGLGDFQTANLNSRAYAVTDDGSVIAGQGSTGTLSRAFRWTAATGIVQLPLVPGQPATASSFAYGMTPDGSMITGECGVLGFGSNTTEFRWTPGAGTVGQIAYAGWGVSADGAYMSGTGITSGHERAWRWHIGDPQPQFLPVPAGASTSHAGAISRDGSTIIGDVEFPTTGTSFNEYGFRWTAAGGMTAFNQGTPNYPISSSYVYLTSGDGSVVVGTLFSPTGARAHAFVWDTQNGLRDLNDLLTRVYGLNLGPWILTQAFAVSADGSWIAGNAYHAAISDESNFAWLVHLNQGCYANCDGSTAPPVLNINDFVCFQARFATGDPYANCDGSTTPPVLNVNDFICFQARFATGCP